MATVIGIIAPSGAGKTTGARTLNPKTTFYIDSDKKGLSWKGWKKSYTYEGHNYMATDNPSTVQSLLEKINAQDNMKQVKTVVIDTMNSIMVAEELRRAKETGFGKWIDLSQFVWNILDYCLGMRDDLTVFILFHSETITDEVTGNTITRIKTNGRKLEKIVLESKLTTVLYADCVDGEYVLRTKLENSTIKAPMDAFTTDTIPNDLESVRKALEEY